MKSNMQSTAYLGIVVRVDVEKMVTTQKFRSQPLLVVKGLDAQVVE
jgi:hypothetical protein